MARPRNNITKLPKEIRLQICELLDNGATYDDVRTDPEIAKACSELDLELHNKTFLAYRSGAEFTEYCRLTKSYQRKKQQRQIAAAMVTGDGIIRDQVDLAAYLLTEKTLEVLQDDTAEFETKDLAALARSIKDAGNQVWQKKEAALKASHAAEIAGYQAQIAELSATIERLTSSKTKVDSKQVADDLDRALGVR